MDYALQFTYSLFTVLLTCSSSSIYSLFGAASISLHQCPLTIQEEAPPPTVTHPHLLHLAGSLMQNEALTLYQSVKALFAITPYLLDPFTH